MKVVINSCFGGFRLSARGLEHYGKLNGVKELFHYVRNDIEGDYKKVSAEESDSEFRLSSFSTKKDFGDVVPGDGMYPSDSEMKLLGNSYRPDFDDDRHNPKLVQTVEELGELANSRVSELKIVEIPDGVDYVIEEYDGVEWIAEKHRTWR